MSTASEENNKMEIDEHRSGPNSGDDAGSQSAATVPTSATIEQLKSGGGDNEINVSVKEQESATKEKTPDETTKSPVKPSEEKDVSAAKSTDDNETNGSAMNGEATESGAHQVDIAKPAISTPEKNVPETSKKSATPGKAKGKSPRAAAAPTPKKTPAKAEKESADQTSTPSAEGASNDTAAATDTAKKQGRKRTAAETPKVESEKPAKKAKADDEESEDEDKKTPLLETPLIVEGKRSRQKVERLDTQMLATPSSQSKEVEIPVGTGAKLGDIPFVESAIAKCQADELKPLHRLLYGRSGHPNEIRKNIRLFYGFDFAKDSVEFTRRKERIDNWIMPICKKIASVFGLEISKKKEDLVQSIAEFLHKPVDLGRKPAERKKKTPKAKRSAKKTGRGGDKKAGQTKAADAGTESDDDEEEDLSDVEPKPKKTRTSTPSKAGTSKAAKSPKATKSTPKSSPSKAKASKSPAKKQRGKKSETAPKKRGGKKTASNDPPTDEELKTTIEELLDDADLEKITMKDMRQKVFDKYSKFDLTDRKDFIKDTIKSIVASCGE